MRSHSLKFLRIFVAIIFLIGLTLLFVDFSGRAAVWLAWVAKIQVVPALLAVNVIAIIFLAALTLVFGRLYCSVICPLGISQDILIWLRRRFAKSNKRRLGLYRFTEAKSKWRYGFLGLFAILFILGLFAIPMSFAGILDPYSAFGRIGSELLAPVVAWMRGNNMLVFSLFALIVAVVTLLAVGYVAWRHGRLICNTVCPIGATLSIFSRYSLLHFDIDTDLCVN